MIAWENDDTYNKNKKRLIMMKHILLTVCYIIHLLLNIIIFDQFKYCCAKGTFELCSHIGFYTTQLLLH